MKRKEVTKLLLLLTLVNSIEGSHIVTNAADENLYMEKMCIRDRSTILGVPGY